MPHKPMTQETRDQWNARRRALKRAKSGKAGTIRKPDAPRTLFNPGPWKSPEPKPWILKGCKP